jgi:putative sterol carrier protein
MSVKEVLQTKVLLYIMGKGLEEVSSTNEEFKEEFEDLDATIQWVIGDNAKMYLKVEGGKFTAFMDAEAEEPTVTLTVEDYGKAKEILTGATDGTSAYMSSDLKLTGEMAVAMKMGQVTEFIKDALGELMAP